MSNAEPAPAQPGDLDLATLRLLSGSHDDRSRGVCLLEAVAWMAGEPHSDQPECACPVLAAYGRRLNDGLLDEERQRLTEFVSLLVGTRASTAVEQARRKVLVASAFRVADHAMREEVPRAMEARGWADLAQEARAIEPIVDRASSERARDAMRSIRNRARQRAAAAAAAAARRTARLKARQPIVDIAITAFREACAITEASIGGGS